LAVAINLEPLSVVVAIAARRSQQYNESRADGDDRRAVVLAARGREAEGESNGERSGQPHKAPGDQRRSQAAASRRGGKVGRGGKRVEPWRGKAVCWSGWPKA